MERPPTFAMATPDAHLGAGNEVVTKRVDMGQRCGAGRAAEIARNDESRYGDGIVVCSLSPAELGRYACGTPDSGSNVRLKQGMGLLQLARWLCLEFLVVRPHSCAPALACYANPKMAAQKAS